MKNLKNEVLSLIGKTVTFKRIAGNTIILYFDGRPGELNVKSLWIDPPWHCEINKMCIVDSEEFPFEQEVWESEKDYERKFNEICNKTNDLLGAKIDNIKIEDGSNSISLYFNNEQVLVNTIDTMDVEGWIYRDNVNNRQIVAFIGRLEVIVNGGEVDSP